MLAESGGSQALINFLFSPSIIFVASCLALATFLICRRAISNPVVAIIGLFVFIGGYVWLCTQIEDSAGRLIALFPDNVPITIMLFSVFGLMWVAMRIKDQQPGEAARLRPQGSPRHRHWVPRFVTRRVQSREGLGRSRWTGPRGDQDSAHRPLSDGWVALR